MKDYEALALQAIGIVDYDIMKECEEQMEEDDDCDMVLEMEQFLIKLVASALASKEQSQ